MFVVATAGHVDHGKSTLARALTGMEPDRWEEEKRRGLTIDLGFVWTRLPSGADVAFVDVPGHERFLGNMLAGIGPAPVVLFVVAADEGWQAQSTDHRDAIAALGISHGLVALTRADRADTARRLEVEADVRRQLHGTALADALVPTSFPSTRTVPSRAASSPPRVASSVDLPEPLAPLRPYMRPGANSRARWPRAVVCP